MASGISLISLIWFQHPQRYQPHVWTLAPKLIQKYETLFVCVGLAALCWSLRKTRNIACFEKKVARSSSTGGLLYLSMDTNVAY